MLQTEEDSLFEAFPTRNLLMIARGGDPHVRAAK